MGGYWGGISPAMRDKIEADSRLLAGASDGVAYETVEATLRRAYRLGLVEGRGVTLDDDADPVERMAFFANRVLENDGALSADSSNDLDDAHDQLAKAAEVYLGFALRSEATVAPTTEGEIYDEEPVRFEDLVAAQPGPSLAEKYEKAIEKTDQARHNLALARRTYEHAHTEEVRLKLQLTERMQARDADHAKAIKER